MRDYRHHQDSKIGLWLWSSNISIHQNHLKTQVVESHPWNLRFCKTGIEAENLHPDKVSDNASVSGSGTPFWEYVTDIYLWLTFPYDRSCVASINIHWSLIFKVEWGQHVFCSRWPHNLIKKMYFILKWDKKKSGVKLCGTCLPVITESTKFLESWSQRGDRPGAHRALHNEQNTYYLRNGRHNKC